MNLERRKDGAGGRSQKAFLRWPERLFVYRAAIIRSRQHFSMK